MYNKKQRYGGDPVRTNLNTGVIMKAPCPELERRQVSSQWTQVYVGPAPGPRALSWPQSWCEARGRRAGWWRKASSRRFVPPVRNLYTTLRVSRLEVGDITSDVSSVSPAARNWSPPRCCATRSDSSQTQSVKILGFNISSGWFILPHLPSEGGAQGESEDIRQHERDQASGGEGETKSW